MQCHDALLLQALCGNEPHCGPAGGFADRLCIRGIVLPTWTALAVRSHELRSYQPNGVTELLELACPVMRRAACLHRNHARWQLDDELRKAIRRYRSAQNDTLSRVHPMQLDDPLREIHTESDDLFHGCIAPQ